MDKIVKALKNLTPKEKKNIKAILTKLNCYNFNGLDIKKLTGRQDIYRVCKGKIRIIYCLANNSIYILAIERRNKNTYNK